MKEWKFSLWRSERWGKGAFMFLTTLLKVAVNLPQANSVLPMMVINKWSACLYHEPRTFVTFSPQSTKKGVWEQLGGPLAARQLQPPTITCPQKLQCNNFPKNIPYHLSFTSKWELCRSKCWAYPLSLSNPYSLTMLLSNTYCKTT